MPISSGTLNYSICTCPDGSPSVGRDNLQIDTPEHGTETQKSKIHKLMMGFLSSHSMLKVKSFWGPNKCLLWWQCLPSPLPKLFDFWEYHANSREASENFGAGKEAMPFSWLYSLVPDLSKSIWHVFYKYTKSCWALMCTEKTFCWSKVEGAANGNQASSILTQLQTCLEPHWFTVLGLKALLQLR